MVTLTFIALLLAVIFFVLALCGVAPTKLTAAGGLILAIIALLGVRSEL